VKHNGLFIGDKSYCDIPFIKVDDEQFAFQELYAIDAENSGMDLIQCNEISDEITAFADPIVIGADPGGNFFIINCNKNDDSIYYWDREHIHYDNNYDYGEKDEEGNIYKIYSSFSEFYDAIILNTGGDKTIKEICF
jgi:hypothetical protein